MKKWLIGLYHIWLGYMAGAIVAVIPISILHIVYGVSEDLLFPIFLFTVIPAWYVCRRVHKHYGVELCP